MPSRPVLISDTPVVVFLSLKSKNGDARYRACGECDVRKFFLLTGWKRRSKSNHRIAGLKPRSLSRYRNPFVYLTPTVLQITLLPFRLPLHHASRPTNGISKNVARPIGP